jgi:alpha-L-fucosidase
LLPDGSIDEGSQKMLKEVGVWMRRNGKAVYGSHAWTIPGEGETVNGKLKMLPGGKLERRHADFKFDSEDFRFTVGKNGALYAFCMTVPTSGTQLKIKSLGKEAKYLNKTIKTVKLLGFDGELKWKQEADGLVITCPTNMPYATSIVFSIE